MLLGVDKAGRMSGAGVTSRVRTTAGVTTAWGRALHAELLKVVTLPAMWWSAAVAGAAAIATMMSVLQNVVDGQGFGFEEIAPTWTLAVQIGFVAAGVAAAGAEHSTAQGMTSLLVTPARGRLAVAWTATYSLSRHLLGSWAPLDPVPWPLLTGILAWWVFSAMASMALAMATRSALVSMTVLVAMSTMISPGVLLIKSIDAARFLPDTAAVRLIANPTTLNYDRLVELLSIPMAAAVCTAWAGGCAAVCCWVWMRRDV